MIMSEASFVSSTELNAKYNLDCGELKKMRENGLPYCKSGKSFLYREKDIHDYFSGKIGNDIVKQEGKTRKIRCSECGEILAFENESAEGITITVMCNNRKPNGERCKTVNILHTEVRGK